MKALLPPDSAAGTYFMAAFLLRLPADMIGHIISQDFKVCNKMAEYADKLYARRRGNTVAAVNANHDSTIHAVSGGRCRESSPHDRRLPTRGAAAGRPPAVQRRQRHLLRPHHLRRTGEEVQAWLPVGPRKRVGRRELNTLGGGMIFLQDDDSKQQFMVDTDAVCNVLPHRLKVQPAGP